ncbi:hypothetical protein SGI37_20455, partial [Providencia rettgeri]
VNNISWDHLYNNINTNEIATSFINTLISWVSKHTNIIKINRKFIKRKPWITSSIIESIVTRDKMASQIDKEPENNDLKLAYKKYRN